MQSGRKSDPELITENESEALIDRLERNQLSTDDQKTIAKIIRSYMFLARMVQETGTKIKSVREFFFGSKSKRAKRKKPSPDSSEEAEPGAVDQSQHPLTVMPAETTRKKPKRMKTTGHGRLSASDYVGAEYRECYHPDHHKGDLCPECGKGRLYHYDTKRQIQLEGHAPVSAICWLVEVLRCSACKKLFNAREMTGKYADSVKTSIALSRYQLGLPFHRLQAFQAMVGVPLPDATQWDLIRQLFDDLFPVFLVLVNIAAQAKLIHHDDTSGRILTLIDENKRLPDGARYGIHSTGFVTVGDHTIILYFTGRCHAGENLDKLLDLRDASLPTPIQMSDAASLNRPKRHADATVGCFCSAHAVRKFKNIRDTFPDPCETILATLEQVYEIDRTTKMESMGPERRRDYHAEHSGPLLQDLKQWMEQQLNEARSVEPNSSLGQAMNYMLKRWEGFTQFLRIPGAPLDNNVVERALKKLINQRKNSLFYRSELSAYIGCVLTSLIETAVVTGINAFDYFNCVQRNRFYVAREPEAWLPWNYQQQPIMQRA